MSLRTKLNLAIGLSLVAILFSVVSIILLALPDAYVTRSQCINAIKAQCNATYNQALMDSMQSYVRLHKQQEAEIERLDFIINDLAKDVYSLQKKARRLP